METEDFRKCIEKASGLNLTRFFDQWFYSSGCAFIGLMRDRFPKIQGKYALQLDKKTVTVSLEQVQSEPFLNHFDIALDIELVDTNNKVYTTTVTFENSKAFAVIPIGSSKIKTIRIDPDGKVLFSLDLNPGDEILSATAKEGGDICSRVWAYKELIKTGTFSALEKVRASIFEEPFYGVRDQGLFFF